MALHLVTPDGLLRIRVRKLSDPELRVPAEEQLELDLFPDDYADQSLFGEEPTWPCSGRSREKPSTGSSLPPLWDGRTKPPCTPGTAP